MFSKNKYLDAFLIVTLITAAAHILVLITWGIINKDIFAFNFFRIISLHDILPSVVEGLPINIAGVLVVAVGYLITLFILKRKV